MTVWGVSNNTRSYWENTGAERLGFMPQQNAEDYAEEILSRPNPLSTIAQQYQGGSLAALDLTRGSGTEVD
jgi:uronate dehydrogenase